MDKEFCKVKMRRKVDKIPQDEWFKYILQLAQENIVRTLGIPEVQMAILEEYNNDAYDHFSEEEIG